MILGGVMEIKNNDPKEPGKKWLIIVAIMMLLAWLANLGWGIWAMDNDRTKGGQWGDIFGAVNALFSGAAFLMIFRGYEMQRYEVKLAKRELEESKQQTKDQKAALDKQNEATERQMFENTFFKLFDNMINELRNVTSSSPDKKGIMVFSEFALNFKQYTETYIEHLNQFSGLSYIDTNKDIAYYDYYLDIFSGYLKANEALITFLWQNYKKYPEYISFVSNRITSNEYIILVLSPLISSEYKNLGKLIKECGLIKELKNLSDVNELVDKLYDYIN